jgi:hypothetical protein
MISLTLGDLADDLKGLGTYGELLRGYRASDGVLKDEPRENLESVLTIRLAIGADLNPVWSLYSIRGAAGGPERSLPWSERQALTPMEESEIPIPIL